jgi:O-acetyl-ADP-ribose deacetylase (regulator of RNase III)
MKEIDGDIFALSNQFDVIVHGCNCYSTMGAGVAKLIKEKYPLAFSVDKYDPRKPEDKLGGISHTGESTVPTIVNAYTQFDFKGKHNADYDAIRSSMKIIKQKFTGKRIGMPMIGAGLAGGDWTIIKAIIEEELKDEDVTVVKLPDASVGVPNYAKQFVTTGNTLTMDDLINDYLNTK